MSNLIEDIKNKREIILTGEIGALFHDIGKCHPNFIKGKSLEDERGLPHHAKDIDKILNSELLDLIKNEKFKIKINREETSVYSIIKDHHPYKENEKENNVDKLVKSYFRPCDRLDSADDKGIVRKKQSLENTIIASPFGYSKEKIDLQCLEKRFDDLQDNLVGLFENYISNTVDISCFRKSIINNLKTTFSHALGETRIPANDVTLWDHSYSTASLFKSVLAAMVLGETQNSQQLKWRILGISCDGIGFINKGRKIAEIKARNEIIENIKKELKKKFEDEYPIGNAIYEDSNGVYFTFPDLSDCKSKELAEECVKESVKVIYDKSGNELWPFFTLSKASRSLTIISDELESTAQKRRIQKITPTLFIESKEEFFENPELPEPEEEQDICPICRIRPKDKGKERCNVCEKRREGRLDKWLNDREYTIWIDEVADVNNRIAPLSLDFNLDKWLDGTMIGSIYSQSFEDWINKDEEKGNLSKILNALKEQTKKEIERINIAINGMKKAEDPNRVKGKIDKKTKEKEELEQTLKMFDIPLEPNKNTVYKFLNIFLDKKDNNKKLAIRILKTFFEENIELKGNNLEHHLNNIKQRIETDNLTKENLATYLFTQNSSPARLYRIWNETEEFLDLAVGEIKDKIYPNKWKRIKFSVDFNDLQSKLKPNLNKKDIKNKTLYIKVKGLEPESLLVFHTSDGNFYTIESLEKFKFNGKNGEQTVEEALKEDLYHVAYEDEPDKNLLKNDQTVKINNPKSEDYYPLIEINKSPLSARLIVPANDSIKIIELITKLYNQRFEKVIGKLPLNIKLLVAKKKFPLYIMLDAGKRMLEYEKFKEPQSIDLWWDIDGLRDDKYYGFYPRNQKERYTLNDLSPVSKGKIFSLYPGYFDFDLLLGTTDRYNIYYKGRKRRSKDYKLFTGRPYYFYQISEMLELWNALSKLSSSQINFIEEMLANKLREWREVKDKNKEKVFREFAKATLWDAFGDKWNKLRDETIYFLVNSAINGLLLDTVILFRHVIKKEVDEND